MHDPVTSLLRIRHELTRRVRQALPASPERDFRGEWYRRHNQRRQEHLSSLGLPLADRSVLEVGAGVGDHATFFIDRGCTVFSTDARAENLAVIRREYPEVEVAPLDLDHADPSDAIEPREVVYCYGTLYHLSDPESAIAYLASKTKDLLLLETCVSAEDGESVNLVPEDVDNVTQAASGTGCRPTRLWIRNRLAEHFPFVYLTRTQPWHPEFPVDWNAARASGNLTRCVFVASRSELGLGTLTTDIPESQTRH